MHREGRELVDSPSDHYLRFEVAGSVEEGAARTRQIHGPHATIAHVEQPPLTT
jgi:hypothetical protein